MSLTEVSSGLGLEASEEAASGGRGQAFVAATETEAHCTGEHPIMYLSGNLIVAFFFAI